MPISNERKWGSLKRCDCKTEEKEVHGTKLYHRIVAGSMEPLKTKLHNHGAKVNIKVNVSNIKVNRR